MTAIIKKQIGGKMQVVFKSQQFPFRPSKKPQDQAEMTRYLKDRHGVGYYHVFAMIGGPVYYFKGWIR